jgi:hypothetical protein
MPLLYQALSVYCLFWPLFDNRVCTTFRELGLVRLPVIVIMTDFYHILNVNTSDDRRQYTNQSNINI